MQRRRSENPFPFALLVACAYALSSQAIRAEPPENTTVYHLSGKNRVHVEECKRLTSDPAERAKMTRMTLAEAKAKGLDLCSRCPGSTTPGDNESDEKKPEKDPAKENPTVYHTPGKDRVHIEGCKRLSSDPAARLKMVKMTLAEAKAKGLELCSRCPGSTTHGKGNPQADDGNPESWVNPAPDTIAKRSFIPSRLAPLVAMGDGGKLVYKPYSDRGDRVLDWSHCGYGQSEVPIPFVPVVETLEPIDGEVTAMADMAYPMGPDSRVRIQGALDRVAAMEPGDGGMRGAVLLRRGTYFLTGGLRVPSGVVLRGEGDGEDGTVLVIRSARSGDTAIVVGNPDAAIEPIGEADSVPIADSYVPSGGSELTVRDAGQFKSGDFICVRKTVSQHWIDLLGMGERLRHIRGGKEGLKKNPWKPESYQFHHYRKIARVDGNTIVLDVMLPQSIAAEHGGGEVFKVDIGALATHAGLESLRVVSNYDTSVKDSGKDADFGNIRTGISVRGAIDSWVRGCTVLHASYAAVQMNDHTMQVTVADCRSLKPVGPKRGGNRYAFAIGGGTLHLVYGCYSEDGRHDFAGGSRNMGPFAFVRCDAVRGEQSEPHHRWSTGFLYDLVTTRDGVLAAINRGDSGSGHGWAAANTMFWNGDAANIVVFDPETPGENNFAIGYRGTTGGEIDTSGLRYANDRAGYWGTPREGGYFGHALMGNGHIESPDRPVKPDSLFEQQLVDRIGRSRAGQVLESLTVGKPAGARKEPAKVLFEDSMAADWEKNWFLDGKKATLEHRDGGLFFSGGTVTKEDDPEEYHAHHAVLWTRRVFEGDLRITYQMKPVANPGYGATLLYIHAQGIGKPPYVEDIYEWRGLRDVPDMSIYFTYMNLMSLSFRNELRCRRYPWRNEKLEWFPTRGLVEPMVDCPPMIPGKTYQVLAESVGDSLRLQIVDQENGKPLADHTWDTSRIDAGIMPRRLDKGRIGIRHMSTRQFIYWNFKVERL